MKIVDHVFDIQIQGKQVASAVDVVQQAGGRMRGLMKTIPGIDSHGSIQVRFVPHSGRHLAQGPQREAPADKRRASGQGGGPPDVGQQRETPRRQAAGILLRLTLW